SAARSREKPPLSTSASDGRWRMPSDSTAPSSSMRSANSSRFTESCARWRCRAAMATTGRVAILGAGAWGTAIAVMLSRRGIPTVLCVRRRAQLDAMVRARENGAYLPGISLPVTLDLSIEWRDSAASADVLVLAVPSSYARTSVAPIADALRPDTILVSATKGIEDATLKTMTGMLAEMAPRSPTAALSGPGFAAEVARG